jgi:predicted DNA-binding protein
MDGEIKFELDRETVEALQTYSVLLEKTPAVIIKEALRGYFEAAEQQLLHKAAQEKDPMTDLDYDEFWDGVDL